jgi:malate synthase
MLWQWVRHETGVLDIGRIVTPDLFRTLLDDEAATLGAPRSVSERLAGLVLGESYTMHAFGDAPA